MSSPTDLRQMEDTNAAGDTPVDAPAMVDVMVESHAEEAEQLRPVASGLLVEVGDELSQEGGSPEAVVPMGDDAVADAPIDVSLMGRTLGFCWRCYTGLYFAGQRLVWLSPFFVWLSLFFVCIVFSVLLLQHSRTTIGCATGHAFVGAVHFQHGGL